jgi:hypothetical protein
MSLVLLCLVNGPLFAASDLYTGEVAVVSQSEAEREAALPLALGHVLRKLSGLQALPETPEVEAALEQAASIVIAFGYRNVPRLASDGTEREQLQLEVRFAPAPTDEMMRVLRLPRWRAQRPPVVLWIVVDDGRERALMPLEYQYAYESALGLAQSRGQPMRWPGLSPALQEQIDLQLLWGGYTDQLLADGADNAGILVAAARREGPLWNVRWSYADSNASNNWRSRGTELELALGEGINQLVDLLVSVNSIDAAGQGVFRSELLLTDLGSSAAYARSLAYLESLGLVDDVAVLGIGPAGLRLELRLNADPSYLESSLRNDGVLEPSGTFGAYRLVVAPEPAG